MKESLEFDSKRWSRIEYIEAVRDYLGLRKDDVYTVGDIKKLFKCATTNIHKWIDSDKLKGRKVPGSRHRRVTGQNLAIFIADNDLMDYIETEEIYSPKKVGSYCGCGNMKIIELMDQGKIIFGKKPFSRHRYVTRETLVKFLEDNSVIYDLSKL